MGNSGGAMHATNQARAIAIVVPRPRRGHSARDEGGSEGLGRALRSVAPSEREGVVRRN